MVSLRQWRKGEKAKARDTENECRGNRSNYKERRQERQAGE